MLDLDDEDLILPVRIAHNSEQIRDGNALVQNYNYLVYEFETGQHRWTARAYLDEIHTVAVDGPFENNSTQGISLKGVEMDQRVLAYLRRRYRKITRLGPTGYVTIQ